ncbi:hypothetical protein HCN51_32290 [Nonomuraea sp. FMUSA5-5]|uniref:Uncharacterized protein n=1 Tax=Nonomuraea composti TaxID=2720023 RepID=A0ABX1BCE1_9ACTN|nr:DUF5946 family protein [Nonomuraea sp. FMUSA5-5]NJP94062.1 hypothetical protein [Nonomuraea sp. FMUSA5-5]
MSRCPECGGASAPRPCAELFGELLTLDYSMRPPWAPVHAVSVSCFHLQHPSRAPSAAPGQWALLHVYLEGGLDALLPMARRLRRLNSHRRGGHTPGAADFPGVPPFPAHAAPPSGFATTIADVALDGGFPADGHEERVRRWARDTVAAWG